MLVIILMVAVVFIVVAFLTVVKTALTTRFLFRILVLGVLVLEEVKVMVMVIEGAGVERRG